MSWNRLCKYPRTRHIEGSRLQPGDEDLEAVPFSELMGSHFIVEEKMDGANAGISFDEDGSLYLQSRGHYLTGGAREAHFDLFKQWGHYLAPCLWEAIGSRYLIYGEWLYAKHTIFYDQLPHYFMEFDIFDREEEVFLSTERRKELLGGAPLVSVRILHAGELDTLKSLVSLLDISAFISEQHREHLISQCLARNIDEHRVLGETDSSQTMEGLYIKTEKGGIVTGRYKYVRASFLTAVAQSESHWLDRPIVPNLLAQGADIFTLPHADI